MKLPILNRLRSAGTRSSGTQRADSEGFALRLEIPGLRPGKPLWQLNVELQTEPQADGERLRLRAHWQANFASALGPALSAEAPPRTAPSSERLPAERVGQWLRRRLDNPLLRTLSEPLLRHDFNSWLELRASTASLADGAGGLLPESGRLKALGIDPQLSNSTQQAPLAQTWAGSTGGPHRGFAQVSLLQFDQRHLPAAIAALIGAKRFQLAGAVVNVIEEEDPAS
jgi:hypothetical protein